MANKVSVTEMYKLCTRYYLIPEVTKLHYLTERKEDRIEEVPTNR